MKSFLILYNAPEDAQAQMAKATEEEKAAGMKAWFAWKDKNEGNIKDFGAPLMPGNRRTVSGDWSASSSDVSGFSIVTAKSLVSAKALFQNHPHLNYAPSCTIDVAEFFEM